MQVCYAYFSPFVTPAEAAALESVVAAQRTSSRANISRSQLIHLLAALDATLPATADADADGSVARADAPPPPPPPRGAARAAPPFVGASVLSALGRPGGERKRRRDAGDT